MRTASTDGSEGSEDADEAVLRRAVATLWTAGADPDWAALRSTSRRRVPLPTYPFERHSFWLGDDGPDRAATPASGPVPAARSSRHARPDVGHDAVAPADEVEEVVAGMWADLLGFPVGVTDDFQAVGGHSLLATQLTSRMRRAFPVTFTLAEVVEHPTVRTQAEVVRDKLERALAELSDEEVAQRLERTDGATLGAGS